MSNEIQINVEIEVERYEMREAPRYQFHPDRLELPRRDFLKVLGAGLLITVSADKVFAQAEGAQPAGRGGRGGRRGGGGGRGGGGASTINARLHIGEDGMITVLNGKVEIGQGARTEVGQAAAEELRVGLDQIKTVMYDSALCPDDGGTYGSQTTPRTIPNVRRAAAAAREWLVQQACDAWKVQADAVECANGKISEKSGSRSIAYGELAKSPAAATALGSPIPQNVALTDPTVWKAMGAPAVRPNMRDVIAGTHTYPSDVRREGMLYGKVLRPATYNATLTAIDLEPAKAMKDVVVVRDGDFVGVAAPTQFQAAAAIEALAKTAKWDAKPQISSAELLDSLKKTAQGDGVQPAKAPDGGKALQATYKIPYIAHCPMEPRAAVAEWKDGALEVWTGSSNPPAVRGELAQAFSVGADKVHVVAPDCGGSFGGKHTGECAVEAARIARAAGKPVSLCWTREEEFMWAYFRPAGVIEASAAVDAQGKLTSWDFVNINSGGAGVESPYEIPGKQSRSVGADSPLRQGSYRALASTANNFARESFMDEMAAAASADPYQFRMSHLKNERIQAVLKAAADKFEWHQNRSQKGANRGIGLACATEKAGYVAACVEVEVDRKAGEFKIIRVVQAFECGPILNPANLRRQVEGAIVMGLGGALSEAIEFKDGKLTNGTFSSYDVPRMSDLPQMDIVLINRLNVEPVGAGECPIVAIAPAIANAVFDACGVRVRQMPIKSPELKLA